MRPYQFTLMVAITSLLACEEPVPKPENPDLLPTSLVTNPRTATGIDTTALKNQPTMDFRDSVFHFGTIRDGEVVTHEFEFSNNGKMPLIISNASAACGCTVAEYPREPVAPGGVGKIKVQFNSAGKPGIQEKSVALTTNSTRGLHVLTMRGEVQSN